MLTDIQQGIVRHMVEDMRPGSSMSLEELNKLNGVKLFRIYELYEFVHDILRESPRIYKFTKLKDVGKSLIYRHEEYTKDGY
jgi:hypothetical protein